MGMPSDIPTPTSCNMVDGHRPNPIRHGENLFTTFEADVAQHLKPDHNMSSHINEETLQLAAMVPISSWPALLRPSWLAQSCRLPPRSQNLMANEVDPIC